MRGRQFHTDTEFDFIIHFHFLNAKLVLFVQKKLFLTFKKAQYPHQTLTPNEFVKFEKNQNEGFSVQREREEDKESVFPKFYANVCASRLTLFFWLKAYGIKLSVIEAQSNE